MVFQNGALFDSLTVGQNVGFLLYEHTTLAPERIQVCGLPGIAAAQRELCCMLSLSLRPAAQLISTDVALYA